MPEAESIARIGPYRLLRALGSGAMGTVYLAEEDGRERVALKVVHPHLLTRQGFFGRFEREAEAGRRVAHPNVVRTRGVDLLVVEGVPWCFLVMEYVEGRTLRTLLDDLGTVPEALVREIGRQVARGLSAIHAAGVVHRDVKPENVLITNDHRVRIMDLGVARLLDASVALTQEGQFAGSLLYAAPEQLARGTVGPAADLYALGVVLHELATGQNPFRGEDSAAVVRAHLLERPPALTEVDPDLSPFLSEVVRTLLAKDPANRFPSADDLAGVLDAAERSGWWGEREAAKLQQRAAPPRVPVRRETRLFGREEDVEQLRDLWAKAKEGGGSTILVEGEAGIGKSRLVDEFLRALGTGDAHVLYGSYAPTGGMGGLSDAILGKFGPFDLAESLRPYLRATPTLVPAFAAFLKREAPPEGSPGLTGEALHTVLVNLMQGLAAEKPLLWVVEDLHFADVDARRALLALARSLESHRVMLLLTTRPGGVPPQEVAHFAQIAGFRRRSPSRLGARQVVLLLEDAFRSPHLADKLGARIALASDGIPFFIFEMIRGLKEGQFITQTLDGSWIESKVIEAIEVPPTVTGLVEARLRDLGREDRAVLDAASVAGYEFDGRLIAKVLDRPVVSVLQTLADIERRSGLVRSAGRRLRFDHHQVQEVIYARLLPALREEYHALVAEALESLAGAADRDPKSLDGALCASLAAHFLEGGRGPRAVRYLDGGFSHLERTWQNEAAIRLAERALAVPDLLTPEQRGFALVRLAGRLGLLGRRAPQEAALREALDLAVKTGDRLAETRSLGFLGAALTAVGRLDEAIALLGRAIEVAREYGLRFNETSLHLNLGNVFIFLGRPEEARESYERCLALAREGGNPEVEAAALGSMGNVLLNLGRVEEALACQEQALAAFRARGQRDNESGALVNIGQIHLTCGRRAEALDHFQRGLGLAREIGYRQFEASAAGGVGHLLLVEERHAEAGEAIERAIALSREVGDRWNEASVEGSLALVQAARGEPAESLATVERMLALFLAIRFREGEAYALAERGGTLAEMGAVEEALRDVREGLAIAREAGARPQEAQALSRLAGLCAERGEREEAALHLEACAAIRRERGLGEALAGTLLTLATLRRQAGGTEEARRLLDEAAGLAGADGPASLRVRVAIERALLDGGSGMREAKELLVRHLDRLGVRDAMAAWFDLWTLSRDPSDLAEAKRLLDRLVDRAPSERREPMRRNVRLHREIESAWAANP
ncbi:MAG: tetratricopeptide repeat protein [Planctomycetes bacterium]|jgi:tetratricopeptide (TPR) repeat protein|nr:tetratricopeptide repeat protein [Planctomycetota bacterium]